MSEIVQITVKVTKEKADMLKTLSTRKHMSMSELVRRFIDKGLNIDSYREDVDFFADVVRDELTSIYNINDIEQILDKRTNRLAKMFMKIGKISSGQLFLLISMFLEIVDAVDEDKRDELTSIYNINDIEQILDKRTNRLAKMFMKIGKISSGQLFLLISMFLEIVDAVDEDKFNVILEKSMRNGINYMQKKDFAINDFLNDTPNLKNIADNLI